VAIASLRLTNHLEMRHRQPRDLFNYCRTPSYPM